MGTVFAPAVAAGKPGRPQQDTPEISRWRVSSFAWEIIGGALGFFVATLVAWHLHLALPSVAFLYFLLIVLAAVRWGFWEATVATVAAVACLDFFFAEPIFSFRIRNTQNWIALGAFEITALVVSRLSTRVQQQARIATEERNNIARLYELSRSILLLDVHELPGPQIAGFMQRALEIESVALFDPVLARADEGGTSSPDLCERVRQTWVAHENADDPAQKVWCRILRVGPKGIGAVALRGQSLNSLVVDAAASIAAVALERFRALEKETRAEAARQSDQLRTAVLDALAHAFKTPLTAIRAASSGLLEAELVNGPQAELIELIDEQSSHLNELATRLLRTARLDTAEVPGKRDYRRVTEVIDEVLKGFPADSGSEGYQSPLFTVSGHRIEVRLQAIESQVYGNVDLLATALSQFVDNAIKYSDANTPIVISVDHTDRETVFAIQNRGPAIRPEDRDRVFERFYRSPGMEHRAPGTGLGLSIARKVAEAHRGRTWVVSSEVEGTTFYLALPRNGMAEPGTRDSAGRR